MKIGDIADAAKKFAKKWTKEDFIYQLLAVYGINKTTITRLKSGSVNVAKIDDEVCLKNNLYFVPTEADDLYEVLEEKEQSPLVAKHKVKFVIVTNYNSLVAREVKNDELLDIKLEDFRENCYFFQALAGFEKVHHVDENPADVKASEKMAKLFDLIVEENPDADSHDLNVFMTRLLFCFFAEDTAIFPENAFTDILHNHTEKDGSDLSSKLSFVFKLLNKKNPTGLAEEYKIFPYVNGGLFAKTHPVPSFSAKARRMLLDCGRQDWAGIHPDIFGSMFQGVIDQEKRHDLGMHYTSVSNIMKVIKPLFLDKLKEAFSEAKGDQKKLEALQSRIANLKIFDPACGSGNFLIIAYKELRLLEMSVMDELSAFGFAPLSLITVSQFYGIEYDDFATEIAILALWLAEHQMNLESKKIFGEARPTLPLKEGAKITQGNACRIDWQKVCPIKKNDEVYVLGNPPYLGSSMQSKEQKEDMAVVFEGIKNYKNLDYIACWFYLGAQYIARKNAQLAFVTTNSICQGEQVALLWPHVFERNLEIAFAYQSFKWSNNARSKAGVTCAILGLQGKSTQDKKLFNGEHCRLVKFINAYLVSGVDVIVSKRTKSISSIPAMQYGNKPVDGGNLILSTQEKNELLEAYPQSESFIRKLLGASEFIRGNVRWCLWIKDDQVEEAMTIPVIAERIEKVKEMRLASKDKGAQKMAQKSHMFREQKEAKTSAIIIPSVTSERRNYVPIGFLDSRTVITNLAHAIYDAEPWIFGVLTSKIHMAWMRTTCGRMKTDYRYSSALCYNTFPIPDLSTQKKNQITEKAMQVLAVRECYPEKTMADLYDPDKMPHDLREAHNALDLTVDQCYRSKPFDNDEERLEHLFKLYEKMIKEDKSKTKKGDK